MANFVYNKFRAGLLQGSYNLTTMVIKVLLATNTYSPDIDAHGYRGSISMTANLEIGGSGYSTGGLTLSGPNVQQDNTAEQGRLYGTAIVWTPLTAGSIKYAVLWGSSGLGVYSGPLICALDLGTDSSTSNFWAVTAGTFQVTWAATGILATT
jgi:hypothetical protein